MVLDARHDADQAMLGRVRQLITLRQAAQLGPYTPRDIRRAIANGALLERVHYTLPHGTRQPLILRDAYLAWLLGDDARLRRPAPSRRRNGRTSFALVGGL